MEKIKIRNGDVSKYLFEMDEKKEKAIPKTFNILDMKDEDLGDFLGEDERKALKVAREQRELTKGRDLCKEIREKEEQEKKLIIEEANTVKIRSQILEEQARKQEKDFYEYKQQTELALLRSNEKIEKLAYILSQLLPSNKK